MKRILLIVIMTCGVIFPLNPPKAEAKTLAEYVICSSLVQFFIETDIAPQIGPGLAESLTDCR
jgi:hypothetical protein